MSTSKTVDNTGTKGGLNNPGNIRNTSIKWGGEITKEGQTFESFDTLQSGVKAMFQNLKAYKYKHGYDTVRKIILAWAPSSDNNNTEAYIKFVSEFLNVTPDEELDLDKYPSLIAAISKQEGNHTVSTNEVNNFLT